MPEVHLIRLLVIFAAIITLMALKRPLYQAICAGLVVTAIFYRVTPVVCLTLVWRVLTDPGAVSILLVLYMVMFLQRMLEARGQIKKAQADLNGLFHNRRVNASVAPLLIGLVPSAAAMLLCGDIVRDSAGEYLDKKEQAFVASWFRHIPETTLPTYSGVLLMSRLSGVPVTQFILGMIVPVLTLAALGYFLYLRRLPRDPGTPRSANKAHDALGIVRHLWTLGAILVLILACGMSVAPAIGLVILAAVFVYRFRWSELQPIFRGALEPRLLLNTFCVLVLKEFISHVGLLETLPAYMAGWNIPLYLVFVLLFFVGGVVSGTNGIIAIGAPMAFAAIPGSGMPLTVLLMCICHAASQVSPTHICLVVASEYFGVTLGQLIRKTLPVALVFCLLMIGYYRLMLLWF